MHYVHKKICIYTYKLYGKNEEESGARRTMVWEIRLRVCARAHVIRLRVRKAEQKKINK